MAALTDKELVFHKSVGDDDAQLDTVKVWSSPRGFYMETTVLSPEGDASTFVHITPDEAKTLSVVFSGNPAREERPLSVEDARLALERLGDQVLNTAGTPEGVERAMEDVATVRAFIDAHAPVDWQAYARDYLSGDPERLRRHLPEEGH